MSNPTTTRKRKAKASVPVMHVRPRLLPNVTAAQERALLASLAGRLQVLDDAGQGVAELVAQLAGADTSTGLRRVHWATQELIGALQKHLGRVRMELVR